MEPKLLNFTIRWLIFTKKGEATMTKHEKVVVSAFTGVLMCDFDDLHSYIEEKLGRPVFTHELADKQIAEEIKLAAKDEFLAICNRN